MRKKIRKKRPKTRPGGKGRPVVKFPAKLIAPIGIFLKSKLKKLERRKKEIEEEDPFANSSRVSDNASPDTEAAEQFGHARTVAIKEQYDRKIIQTKKALTRIKLRKYGICEDCGQMIDTDRLVVYPEATLCARCKKKKEKSV
jgi:RNA polymerase-binding transcription factor DksA